jgi:outer membrane protein assembly factor BamB
MKLHFPVCSSIALLFSTIPSIAADWPAWRGPNGDGISTETGWKLAAEPQPLWEAEVGLGFSSFVVANEKVMTTGHADGQDTIWCLDAVSGKVLWKYSYAADLGDKYYEGGTSNTPTIDGDKLYHLSRWGDLFCFEIATGKVIWERQVQKETESSIPDWGYAGAPLVQGNLLIINVGKAGMGVDKMTGKIIWKSDTDSAGYSTPVAYSSAGKKLAIVSSTDAYTAIQVDNGTPIWSYRWATRYGVNASDPIVNGEHVFISTGYNKGCTLLKINDSKPTKIWENKFLKNQFNSSVLIGNCLYGIDGDQNSRCSLKCLDFMTGAVLWEEKSIGFGSLMASDGRLIILTEKGELVIAKATSNGYEESSRAQVLSGRCWSAPVLANGRLYVRNAPGKVLCLQAK